MLSLTQERLFDLDQDLKDSWLHSDQETAFETNIKKLINDANKLYNLAQSNPNISSSKYVVNMKYTIPSENISGYYSGPVSNKIPCGRGIFVYLSDKNSSYIGDFVNGIPQGYGCTTDVDYICRGQINNGKYEGLVSIKFKNKDSYYGKMDQGIIHGLGEYTFADQTKLTGLFLNQEFHSGTVVYNDGIICKGYFIDVVLITGTKIYPDQTCEQGIFKNGYLHYGSRIKDDEYLQILDPKKQIILPKKKAVQTGVFYKEIQIADKYKVIPLERYKLLQNS